MYAALLFSEVCTKETLDCIHATTTTGSSTSVSTQVLSRDSPWEGSVARMEGCNSGGGIIVPCTQYSCAELGKRCDHVMDAKPEYAPTCCESHEWKCTFVDDALLLHETCVSTVLVHEWVCSCGKEKVAFDGKSSGMFNWSNKTLATHELCGCALTYSSTLPWPQVVRPFKTSTSSAEMSTKERYTPETLDAFRFRDQAPLFVLQTATFSVVSLTTRPFSTSTCARDRALDKLASVCILPMLRRKRKCDEARNSAGAWCW